MSIIFCVNNRVGKFQTFYGTQLCKAEGCFERAGKVSGYCKTHLKRTLYNIKPRFHGTKLCSICTKKVYAKKLCQSHYHLYLVNGPQIHKYPFKKCSIDYCPRSGFIRNKFGFCSYHYERIKNGYKIEPVGNKGENNINWKGGIAEYPNHSEMKRNRLQVLREANYICEYCGNTANQIHHKDFSKDNHAKENLAAICNKCNSKLRDPNKPQMSKYRRLYGYARYELKEMGFLQDIILMQQGSNQIQLRTGEHLG